MGHDKLYVRIQKRLGLFYRVFNNLIKDMIFYGWMANLHLVLAIGTPADVDKLLFTTTDIMATLKALGF